MDCFTGLSDRCMWLWFQLSDAVSRKTKQGHARSPCDPGTSTPYNDSTMTLPIPRSTSTTVLQEGSTWYHQTYDYKDTTYGVPDRRWEQQMGIFGAPQLVSDERWEYRTGQL
jgi:hypothetical protein